jgi:hypothetical protein
MLSPRSRRALALDGPGATGYTPTCMGAGALGLADCNRLLASEQARGQGKTHKLLFSED